MSPNAKGSLMTVPKSAEDSKPIPPGMELVIVKPKAPPLLAERTDLLEGDAPPAAKVEAFLSQALAASGGDAPTTAGALVPWICDVLLSNHSVKAYGRDLADFAPHIQPQGVAPLNVTAAHA